jgi:hypothetical protein
MGMNPLLIALMLWSVLAAQTTASLPTGYRVPVASDYTGGWQENRAKIPTPFHVRADFNGDSLLDDAWILLAEHGQGFAFFVALGTQDGAGRWLKLEDGVYAQALALQIVKPGRYETAYAKGSGSGRKPGELKVLGLVRPGIELLQFESGTSYFWWDTGASKFERTWITD